MANPYPQGTLEWQQYERNYNGPGSASFGTASNAYGGQVWNGTSWGPPGPGNQGQTYRAPYALPTSTREWEQNILTNPKYISKASENPLGLNAALLYTLLGQREANAASEGDFNQAMGIAYRNRDYTRGLLQNAGQGELQDEARQTGRERAGLDNSLINRGLYNSTVKDALGNRLNEASGRRRDDINRNTSLAQVGNENQYANLLTSLVAQRQRIFNPSAYSNLAQAASSPSGSGGNNALATIAPIAGGIIGSLIAPGAGTAIGTGLGSVAAGAATRQNGGNGTFMNW